MHSIEKIANYINATRIDGDSQLIITGLCGIDSGKSGYISYIHDNEYSKYLESTEASAIIINNDFSTNGCNDKTLLRVDNAANAFSKLVYLFHDKPSHNSYISDNAIISRNAKIGLNIILGIMLS